MGVSLVSLNIEWDKQLGRALPFLRKEKADIVCIQELYERHIPLFEEACGPCVAYAPISMLSRPNGIETVGDAIFTRLPAIADTTYYVGSRETVRVDDEKSDCGVHVLLYADVEKEGATYRIATTHFTWTEEGQSTEKQLGDLELLLDKLDMLGEFALAGDFNAPRGRDTFSLLAARYTDNIPSHYKTSLDLSVHKARNIPEAKERIATYMVDGLFTTPGYRASNARLQFGVSDHAAIVATIEKAP